LVVVLALAGCTKDSKPVEAPPASFKVQMPRARSSGEVSAVTQVSIKMNDAVFVNGVEVADEAGLTARLRELRGATPSLEVHIQSDPGVAYARIVVTIDAIRQAGVVDVSFDSGNAPVELPVDSGAK
jgi:biopolymer transport protein ExbD